MNIKMADNLIYDDYIAKVYLLDKAMQIQTNYSISQSINVTTSHHELDQPSISQSVS